MTSGPIVHQLYQGRSSEICIDLEDDLWLAVLLYASYAKEEERNLHRSWKWIMTSSPIVRRLCQGRSRETYLDLENELWRAVLLNASYAKEEAEKHV